MDLNKLINCPPDDSRDVNDILYRFTGGNPPHSNDFVPEKAHKIADTVDIICIKCGLSVYLNHVDAKVALKKVQTLYPKSFGSKKIAFGQVAQGKVKKTFLNGHHTWWPLVESTDLHSNFEIIQHE